MKKLILITVLTLVGLGPGLYAQSYLAKQMSKTKTELTFNANDGLINIRDFVVLKEGRMILELSDLDDYESFRNLDSLLTVFKKDIAFYKDSLSANPTGNVRIDYAISPEYSFKKIRFKKYNADGNIFMNQDGDIARLKFEQDTVRIIIQKIKPGIARGKHAPCSVNYSVQATFVLGNYYDIDKVLEDKVLNDIVDTLYKASQTKRLKDKKYPEPLSIVYNPYYSGKNSFKRYEGLLNNEYETVPHKIRYFSIHADIGAGLVRNTLVPTADIGMQYNKYFGDHSNDHNIYRLSAAPYYFFDKNEAGNYIISNTWFINADIGSIYDKSAPGWFGKEATIGIGYLVAQKGGYFQKTTFKIFTDILIVPEITIVPEVIFTNNCKQIFPGFTLNVF